MEKQIDMILDFNENKNSKSFFELYKDYNNYKDCIYCNNPIVYYDTKVSKKLNISGKSFNSKKIVNDKEYYLCVCENCLTKKYPDYQNKNKSRVFNQMNTYSKYAFNIDDYDYKKQRDSYILTTEKNLIRKYGEDVGKQKWNEYKQKQSYSNSFEYKSKKHGWTKEQYEQYNLSRAITKENLIKKYNKQKGQEIWEDYVNRQRITKSKEYYVNKYGEEKWVELCKLKAHTLENYIKWYGNEEIALQKIKERHNMWKSVSKSSQKFLIGFDNYIKSLHPDLETYFDSINKEFMVITESRDIYYLDYFIKDWNICIEYNGDIFHANPNIYNEFDKPIPKSNITAKKIWEKDNKKITTILNERNIKTIVIWENNLPTNEELLKMIYDAK
jgi:hypothetical protein